MKSKLKLITMQELHAKLGQRSASELFLDVRSPEEFAEGHISGSRNIDHEEVHNHAEELKKYERVYVYCRSGRRAQYAVGVLEALGVKDLVCVAHGGMEDWMLSGYPVES